MKTITANQVSWMDILSPQEEDLERLKQDFKLHPFIARQFLPPVHRPKIEEYPDQLFVVLHFPVYNKKTKQTKLAELDLIITPQMLVTSHQEEIPALKIFLDDCQIQQYHKKQYFKSSGLLAFSLLDFMIDACLPMLDHISENIEEIEKQVFEEREKEMLTEIALVKRDLIDFRRAIKPQRSVLEILDKKCQRIFGHQIRQITQEVIGSNIRVWNVLENHRELINSIEQTNNSLLSHKLSHIMKILTIVSFITFPLAIVTGFFGMNVFDNIPAVKQNPLAWLMILTVIFLIALTMFVYFKIKKWL